MTLQNIVITDDVFFAVFPRQPEADPRTRI